VLTTRLSEKSIAIWAAGKSSPVGSSRRLQPIGA
jgi:hypothetical protein